MNLTKLKYIAIIIIGVTCFAGIDSVWFEQERFCDDWNSVLICYDLSGSVGDEFFINLRASSDGGRSWHVPLDLFLDDYDDLGEGILPGRHCFYWEMGVDLPGIENDSFIIEIIEIDLIDTAYIIDTIDISGYEGYGIGLSFDLGFYYVYDSTRGLIIQKESIDPIAIAIDSWFVGTGGSADIDAHGGFIYYSLDNSLIQRLRIETGDIANIAILPERGLAIQGFAASGNNLYISYFDEIDDNALILELNTAGTLPITSWDTLSNETILAIYAYEGFDNIGNNLLGTNDWGRLNRFSLESHTHNASYYLYPSYYEFEGFCFDNRYGWVYQPDRAEIFKIYMADSTASSAYSIGNVDSKGPGLILDCPSETGLYPADIAHFTWSIDDANPHPDFACSIFVDYGSAVESYFTADSSFNWTVLPCCSAVVSFKVRDYFCNWSETSCNVHLCHPLAIEMICPEGTGEYTSCENQSVHFITQDTLCGSENAANAFITAITRHSATDSSISHYDIGDPELTIISVSGGRRIIFEGVAAEDGDEISIQLDSLHSSIGCTTVP